VEKDKAGKYFPRTVGCWLWFLFMCLCIPGSNWNLEMLVFVERGKLEYPEKNMPEQRREPNTNSTHI